MKVIGIGDNVVDDYQHIRTVFPGGNALNFSVFASILGCDAAYLGVFGNDAHAEHVQKVLREIGVDCSHCRVAEGPNGRAVLTIEDGERIFISSNQGGVSKTVPMAFIFNDIDYLKSFSLVHTSKYSYMDSYLSRLQGLNLLLSYDFSDDFDREHAFSLCSYLDFGFFSCAGWSLDASRALLEEAIKSGCSIAVATRGPKEVVLYDGKSWHQQPTKTTRPKDTLGAGDAFITGFLVSYLANGGTSAMHKEALLKDSLEKAAAFAAEICQLQGAFGHGLPY